LLLLQPWPASETRGRRQTGDACKKHAGGLGSSMGKASPDSIWHRVGGLIRDLLPVLRIQGLLRGQGGGHKWFAASLGLAVSLSLSLLNMTSPVKSVDSCVMGLCFAVLLPLLGPLRPQHKTSRHSAWLRRSTISQLASWHA
jgi:hypothetical protein